MAKRRISEVPERKIPNVSVPSSVSRSKPIEVSGTIKPSTKSSREKIHDLSAPTRSKPIVETQSPISTRSKAVKELTTSTNSRSFFSRKDMGGGSVTPRASVESISGGTTRSKLIVNRVESSRVMSNIGGGSITRNTNNIKPLKVSDL